MIRFYISFIIPIIFIAFIGCANKEMLKDPSKLSGGAPFYTVNNEGVQLPAFLDLPSVNHLIKLNFKKPAAKPLAVWLRYAVDGWEAPNGKILSDGKSNFGLILDFSTGSVYEMPKNELDLVLSKFTADDATRLVATFPEKEGGGFVKMALIDAQGNFNKQELKYLNKVDASSINNNANNGAMAEEKPIFMNEMAKPNSGFSPKNSVVANSPVISAAANDQYDRLAKLLSSGGNINETDVKTGNNALISSIRHGAEDVSKLLIDKGIDVRHVNFAGQNALHVSADAGFYDISKKLINKGINVNSKDKEGNSPLLYAAASPNPHLSDLLLENGARIEDRNNKGETPLAVASFAGNTKTIENLVKKGADTKTKDKDGNNLVMKAVSGGNAMTVSKLLDFGVSPDEKNNFGVRPIHAAVAGDYENIAKNLLDKGANVNAKDSEGNTPLILASAGGNSRMVNGILNYKPDIAMTNNAGQNAYDAAMAKGFDGARRTIGDLMRDSDSMTEILFEKAAANDMAGVEDALARGARINSLDVTTGNNVLFTAVANNYKNLASVLIGKGVDVNHLNVKGNTPLIVAVTSADKPMIDLLIKSGAFVNARNNTGDTALIWASKLKRPDMVRALLLAGADANIKNSDGVSAYIIADNEGTPEILRLLQAAGGHK